MAEQAGVPKDSLPLLGQQDTGNENEGVLQKCTSSGVPWGHVPHARCPFSESVFSLKGQ